MQWLLDFGYKIVIPWLLRGISEQNALSLGQRPRDTGVLFRYTPSWRASETQSGVYKFELEQYIYVWRYICYNSSACHAYVMWAELVHCHFLYVPAVLNVVTTGNGTGTKNVSKSNRSLGFEFSIQFSVYGATTVAKVSLFSTWTRCTVSFYSM